jgi:putative selenate reductase
MLKGMEKEMTSASAASLAEWCSHAGPDAVPTYIEKLHHPAGHEGYTREGTSKLPRHVDHVLEMWGCVACNLCVTVCPNDAFLRLPTPDHMDVEGRQQYFCLAELCNECGNCTTFCPEDGEPWNVKPRLFLDRDRFANDPTDRPAFLIEAGNGGFNVTASEGFEDQVEPLQTIFHAEEGLPMRPADLKG